MPIDDAAPERACGSCAFAHGRRKHSPILHDNTQGTECRRYPPQRGDMTTGWPAVLLDAWCGEWAAAPAATAAT